MINQLKINKIKDKQSLKVDENIDISDCNYKEFYPSHDIKSDKFKSIIKKNLNLDNKKMFKFQIIKNSSIIDEFNISKNFNFEKYNLHYSWDEENFIIKYAKKEIQKNIYLACTKRGNNGQNCHGKAKFEKNTGKIIIYEK